MRKRIEIAILSLLAVVLGLYVYDRLHIRMGGTPSSILSEFATEEDWMLDTVLRDIAGMTAYAKKIPADDVEVAVSRISTGPMTLPTVSVHARVGSTVVERLIPLEDSFWNPSNYEGFAAELLGLLGQADPGASRGDSTEALRALLDLRPSILLAENERISRRLSADIRDASAHEEAALLLGVFGLREAAYEFDDTRLLLLRISAHLAVARALRGGDPPTASRLVAEATLLALTGRQAELLPMLDRFPRSDAAQAFRSALYMYSTDDWRTPAPSKGLLVELMRFRAIVAALGSSNALDRMGEQAQGELADWGRILTWLSARDVTTRWFIETQFQREFAEIWLVVRQYREEIQTPAELGEALNVLPEGLVGSDGPSVLSWGLWAAFFQRQLCAALVASDQHLRNALGLPKQAESFGREAERVFSDLMMNPIVEVRRTRYVGARVEDTVGMDEAIALTRRHPELVNPNQWSFLEDTIGHMMRRRGMPSSASWLSANVLVSGLIDNRDRLSILEKSVDPGEARRRMAELAPRHTFAIEMKVEDLEKEEDRFEALSSALGDRLDFDRHALRRLLDAAETDADRLEVKRRMCGLDANECDRYGWELVDADKPVEAAAAFQRMVDRAPDRVGVCNESYWLVNYYYDHKRVQEAMKIADMVAEAYCYWGLQTKADLLERMGRYPESEAFHRASHERYGARGIIPNSLLGLYYRRARQAADARYEPRFEALLAEVFPDGLEPLPAEMDSGPPKGGVLLDGDSFTLKEAGIRGGDVLVGLDGFRVSNLAQYDAIRLFRPETGGARDARLRVYRQNEYLDAEVHSRERRLYVKVRTLGTPAPSVKER